MQSPQPPSRSRSNDNPVYRSHPLDRYSTRPSAVAAHSRAGSESTNARRNSTPGRGSSRAGGGGGGRDGDGTGEGDLGGRADGGRRAGGYRTGRGGAKRWDGLPG